MRVCFERSMLDDIARNLGCKSPETLTAPQLRAVIYNLSCNVAPVRKVS